MSTRIDRAGTTRNGQTIHAATLDNGNGVSMRVLSLGGIVTHLHAPDRDGTSADITLGFDDPQQYEELGPYFGAICGRVANRIAAGRFTLDGAPYQVTVNEPPNHLHGGAVGYDKRLWSLEPAGSTREPAVRLSLIDPAGCEGYPGTVSIDVVYTLQSDNTWRIEYAATTDAPTPINLTHHIYFNLRDAGRTPALDHRLQMHASHYTPTDADRIPTGRREPVEGTVFDFRSPRRVGQDIDRIPGDSNGYDTNFIIDGPAGTLRPAAELHDPHTGRVVVMRTTEPAVQFYAGSFIDPAAIGKSGIRYPRRSGLCLEAQHFPDSINQPDFPSTILRPGETYRQTTEYQFVTK